ncbi:SprT family zinc-dependent metalloprotease [Rhodoglobus aureus]|uniref:SprT family zinc-dependent metalloprotease n=1 Tax=Rhodoglobus aureus TaxID=191497 RepID=A0ABP4G2F7_9MICO
MSSINYGSTTIDYRLERQPRVTLAITVEPSGDVLAVAPETAGLHEVEALIRKRARWIIRQQEYFTQFTPRTPPRRFIAGETHKYLGRQYRLRIEPGEIRQVRMTRGFILVSGAEFDDTSTTEQLVTNWYRERAQVQFEQRLKSNLSRFANPEEHRPTSLRLQRMTTCWGSMSPGGRLLLNPDLVQAPADTIDYVITHELCHRAIPNHSRAFYGLQTQVLPDWETRKLRLERAMA